MSHTDTLQMSKVKGQLLLRIISSNSNSSSISITLSYVARLRKILKESSIFITGWTSTSLTQVLDIH